MNFDNIRQTSYFFMVTFHNKDESTFAYFVYMTALNLHIRHIHVYSALRICKILLHIDVNIYIPKIHSIIKYVSLHDKYTVVSLMCMMYILKKKQLKIIYCLVTNEI